MNKSGKGLPVILWVVIALVAAYLIVPGVPTLVNSFLTGGGGTNQPTTINTVNPYITVTALDKQASGTVVAVSAQGSFDSGGFKTVTLGSDTAVPGQKLALLLINNTQYHNAYVPEFTVASTSFPVAVQFNKNASVTENIYSTTGLVISNEGGAGSTNQTKLGAGATYNMKDAMSGTALSSTQDMLCIIELSNGSAVSTTAGLAVTYDGKSPSSTSKPTWYTVNGSNSNVYLFEIPALSSGTEVSRNIQIVSKTTGAGFSATDLLIKTCYTKEWFNDPNTGKATYDVADSNGALKSIAQYKYKVYFQ